MESKNTDRARCVQTDMTALSLSAEAYAGALSQLIDEHVILRDEADELAEIVRENPALTDILSHPGVKKSQCEAAIDRIVPPSMRSFVKVMRANGKLSLLGETYGALERLELKKGRRMEAVLFCVTKPDEKQEQGIRDMICRKYGCVQVSLDIRIQKELLGGFILRVGSDEYDWSISGRLNRLEDRLTRR